MKTLFSIQNLIVIAILMSILVATLSNPTLASCALPIVMLIGLIAHRIASSTHKRAV